MLTKNAYIHIPFCKSKCNYCSFVSFNRLELKEKYINALITQIKAEYKDEKLNTLYFGGGTPSLLTIEEIKSIIDLFEFESNAEITCEVNPDSVDLSYLIELRQLGFNRLSIGAQTFNDDILTLIGRRHSSEQIKSAVKNAKTAGFENISLDFIYGLPAQDINGFENDLNIAVSLDVQHISLYGLKIDKNCFFDENPPEDFKSDSDVQADMYLKAVELLKNNSFGHYEISNFSKNSFESKHNLNYWNNSTYYGFGCAASGYGFPAQQRGLVRYTNQSDLEKYIQNPLKKKSEQKLSRQEILEEEIFLGFRKITGININEINKKFEINFENKYSNILQKYSEFFAKTKFGCALTLDGIMLSNEILAEFLDFK